MLCSTMVAATRRGTALLPSRGDRFKGLGALDPFAVVAVDDVVLVGEDDISPRAAVDDVAFSVDRLDPVVARAAVQAIVTLAADQPVGAGAAEKRVVPSETEEEVVASEATQGVVAGGAGQSI